MPQYYVPLDEYLDIKQLTSLEGILKEKLERALKENSHSPSYFSAGERLDPAVPNRVGTRTIRLMKQIRGGYYQVHEASCFEKTELVEDFPELMEFVNGLPFKSFGRPLCQDRCRVHFSL